MRSTGACSTHHTSIYTSNNKSCRWFGSVVVMTSALHAEGLEFDPRRGLVFSIITENNFITCN